MATKRLEKKNDHFALLHQVASGPLTVRINVDHVFVLKPKPPTT